MANYKREFPDFDTTLYCPTGFIDASYHNDTMPHVMKRFMLSDKEIEVNIWQDYVDVDKREYDTTKQYAIQIVVDGDVVEDYETDALHEVEKFVADLDNIVKAVVIDKKSLKELKEDKIKLIQTRIFEGADVRSSLSDF